MGQGRARPAVCAGGGQLRGGRQGPSGEETTLSAPFLTFQDAILRLLSYWSDQGCLVWQPHNVEVGAGTLNPATFLRVLGPEPWNVVYVEPSIRPDDGRYGQNPNRMARHHQLQVILKPDPGNPQELFLDSLGTLGVDLRHRDIRFVEDNWESPALGAWGLGWEVWLDGLEITQFTYFQQAGSLDLDPVAVEITYGLDRIMMALQDVRHFKDLWWNDRVRGADTQVAAEEESSRYFFETASIERLRQLYDLFEAEAQEAIAGQLPTVAHDYVLKCSHAFNILDARGAVGVTERALYFGRMRRLSRAVAECFVAKRALAGHTLLDAGRPWVAGKRGGRALAAAGAADAAAGTVDSAVRATDSAAGAPDSAAAEVTAGDDRPTEPADFVLEVGTEELPVGELDAALASLAERVPKLLDELRLERQSVVVCGTPRRLVILVEALALRQTDQVEEIVGPPVAVAFAADGSPTPAGEGFARSMGVGAGDLRRIERGGQERVVATRRTVGRPAAEVLAASLPALLGGISFGRSMRWNDSRQSFARPVRWLLALHGSTVVGLQFAAVVADRMTRGLRAAGGEPRVVSNAGDYRSVMAACGIEIDTAARQTAIVQAVTRLAAGVGGRLVADPGLVAEVANLVESPRPILGSFGPDYLALPEPVLTTVLRRYQRCFPVHGPDGRLLPYFVTVANGAQLAEEVVRHGNEAVVAARFADAAYFWRRDTSRPLEDFVPALARLTFHPDLGSMLDKTRRLERLVPRLAARLGLDEPETAVAVRAATLAKADLATEMVIEFTSLQGVMGREYAMRSGEPEAVAEAIYEQYLPRGSGDDLPRSGAGTALALADRLDSLAGLFAADIRPSGAADPYGLRRAALGVVAILAATGRRCDLGAAVEEAAAELPIALNAAARSDLAAFLSRRLEGYLRDQGHSADVVASVLAVHGHDPARAAELVPTLGQHVQRPEWPETLHAYARCLRIVRPVGEPLPPVDPRLFREPEEHALLAALDEATDGLDPANLDAVLNVLAGLAPTINQYFDGVLVMADDSQLRTNRLSLVQRVAQLPQRLADLSLLQGF